MNAHPTLAIDPAPFGADAPAPEAAPRARALAERQLKLLERLAEAGIQVALAVEREAQARSPDSPSPEAPNDAAPEAPNADAQSGRSLQGLAMAYARAARAVRMTVLLQSRVLRELEAAERLAAINAPVEAARQSAARHEAGEARKASIERIVRRVAEGQHAELERVDALVEDAADRLDDGDVYGDVLTRPMGEIVARICADLGLDPDWSGLAQEAWAQAERAAGAPGSPFAASGLIESQRSGLNFSTAHPHPRARPKAGPRTGSGGDPGFLSSSGAFPGQKPGVPHPRE